jgi:hypothetical protein
VSSALVEPVEAGIDTISAAWYVDSQARVDAFFSSYRPRRAALGAEILPDKIEGMTVGWYPAHRLVWCEGTDPDHHLRTTGSATRVIDAVEGTLRDMGLPSDFDRTLPNGWNASPVAPGRAGLRRADATCTVRAPDGMTGLMLITALAAAQRAAGAKSKVHFSKGGQPETVYKTTSSGATITRIYDKGIEAGIADRGVLIRMEAQRRYQSGVRPLVEELAASYPRDLFHKRFAQLVRASKGIKLSGPHHTVQELIDRVDAGVLKPDHAEKLMGFVIGQAVTGGEAWGLSETTAWRRARDLRSLGISYDDGVLDQVEVDVHAVLEEVLESDLWESSGD